MSSVTDHSGNAGEQLEKAWHVSCLWGTRNTLWNSGLHLGNALGSLKFHWFWISVLQIYCILQHSNKKYSVFFLKPAVAVSVFLDLEIICFSLFYFLVLISTLFCMWPQKNKDSCFCCCLSILPVIISFISGSSSAIFFSSFLKFFSCCYTQVFCAFHWTILPRPLPAHSTLIVP